MAINILSQTAWWPLNKKVTQILGIDAALLLSDLISKQEYFEERNLLDKEGFFFNTKEDIESDTTLPRRRQESAIKILTDYKLIEYKIKGVPAKSSYKVIVSAVNQFVTGLHV